MDDNQRPWGYYEILSDAADHKVKRITVYKSHQLSLQSHNKRAEHWYIICGKAEFTLDDNKIPLLSGMSVDIPLKAKHRIKNTGEKDLVFIEIQTGSYFGEDDIVRYEDDYNRL